MAIGIPKQKTGVDSPPLTLQYPDKKSRQQVLEGKTIPLLKIHQGMDQKRLYFGDNLDILRCLLKDESIKGQVKLIYIDPPFATQSEFFSRKQRQAYSDTLTGSQFIDFLRDRLILLHEILSDQGSLYLHLDEKMIFAAKIILDEIFGAPNYRNLIIRQKCNPKNYTRKAYGKTADFILFYTKTDRYIWNPPVEKLSEKSLKEYQYIEPETGRRFMKVPLHAPGTRNGETGKPWRGILPPPGKHWQYPPAKLDEMDAKGEIFWSKNGNPRRKVYLDQHPGVGVQDIWLDFRDAHNQNIKITGYPTEKNPDLLRRIVAASSNPGDLVLDCFAGSGTTLAVADELQRNWIGVDNSPEAFATILERFHRGLKPMGDYSEHRRQWEERYIQRSLFELMINEGLNEGFNAEDETNIPESIVTDFSVFTHRDRIAEIRQIIDPWLGHTPV